MSRPLTLAAVIEKNKLASGTPFLAMLDIEVVDPNTGVVNETIHFVRNSEDINYAYNGNLYIATEFNIELKSEAGSQPQLNLTVKDITRALQGRMQAYGGGVGFNVTFMVIRGDALTAAPDYIDFFQITTASAQEYEAQFTLGAENALTMTFPRRRQTKDFCQWRYKDPDTCAYGGTLESCDLTLKGANGCRVHQNSPNYGGNPGINSNGIRYV
jgi:hypothetical protein